MKLWALLPQPLPGQSTPVVQAEGHPSAGITGLGLPGQAPVHAIGTYADVVSDVLPSFLHPRGSKCRSAFSARPS